MLTQHRDDATVQYCSRWLLDGMVLESGVGVEVGVGWGRGTSGVGGGARDKKNSLPQLDRELDHSAAPSTPPPTCKQPGLVRSLVATFHRPQNECVTTHPGALAESSDGSLSIQCPLQRRGRVWNALGVSGPASNHQCR